MIWLLSILLFLFVTLCVIMGYYLYRFARVIMLFEDDISDVLSALDDVDMAIKNIVGVRMYFDSEEIKRLISDVMETVKMARFSVNKMSKRFTERSKQKYILIEEVSEENLDEQGSETAENRFNRKEGTVFHVGRSVN